MARTITPRSLSDRGCAPALFTAALAALSWNGAAWSACAATPGGGPPAKSNAPARTLVREVLPNGVTLLIDERRNSEVVGMEVVSRVGTAYEEPYRSGLANLTLRVAQQGAGVWSAAKIQEWFEDRGSSLDLRTHPDFSEMGAAVASGDFPGMAGIMASIARDANLTPSSFEAQRRAVMQQLTSTVPDEQSVAYRSLRTLLAGASAYGRPETGLAGTVSQIRLDDVRRFYHTLFAPQQIIVSVSGNVRTAPALSLLRRLFGAIPARLQPPPPVIHLSAAPEPRSMVLGGNGTEAWIMVGYRTPGLKAGDYAAVSVLNAVIGGSNSARLPAIFRERTGVYDSGSFIQPFADQTHVVGYIRGEPLLWNQQEQRMRPVIDDFYRQIVDLFSDISEHGVTEEQAERGRQFVLGQYLRTQERNRDHAAYLAWYESLGLSAEFDREYPAKVRGVQVSQLNDLARTYLKAPLGATVIMLPRPRVEEAQ